MFRIELTNESERYCEKAYALLTWASLVAQTVKNLPAVQETQVRSLGQEDPLEKGMATHSSILAWRIPMDRGAWWPTVPWDRKELDMTERLTFSLCQQISIC